MVAPPTKTLEPKIVPVGASNLPWVNLIITRKLPEMCVLWNVFFVVVVVDKMDFPSLDFNVS